MPSSPLAWHHLYDFHHVSPEALQDVASFRQILIDAICRFGGTYITDVFHEFSPHGLSGIIIIAESHVAIHTWPERSFVALDIFSCTPKLLQDQIAQALGHYLQSLPLSVHRHERGILP